MGSGRWSPSDWASYSSVNISNKTTVNNIYSTNTMTNKLNPYGVLFRESCDSVDNPKSTPIIVGLDVTGSMGMIANVIARQGLNILATEIYNRKPITDPHIMFMGIGDVTCDDAPLQVTQFEADIRIAEQLTQIYLENGGGGNNSESYILPWYFAAMHTKIDSFNKRGKKGFLFTIGDEKPPEALTKEQIMRVLGSAPEKDLISAEELFEMASREYEIFHIMIEEGSYMRARKEEVMSAWTNLIGKRAISLSDHTKLAETILAIIQTTVGDTEDKILSGWDGSTQLILKESIKGLTKSSTDKKVLIFD